MKTLAYAVVLLAFLGFSLLGCTDRSQSPVAPTDQIAQAPASLEKVFTTPFTGSDYPYEQIDAGVVKEEGRKVITHGLKVREQWDSDSDLMKGTAINEVNGVQDKVTGEGEVHGKVVITPTKDVGGGVWEGEYHGKIVRSATPGIWIGTLSGLGHGRGGTIHGMKYRAQIVLEIHGFPATFWVGTLTGEIQSH